MTKTIFKTLLSLLILFSISCGDKPTGSGGGGTIGDNKEPPQKETEASKNFINNTFNNVVSYKGEIVEVDDEYNCQEYSFDGDANITEVKGNGGGGMPGQTYKFWGMAPDNKQIAYYYSDNGGSSYYPYQYALKYINGNINGNIAEESAYEKMQAAMLEVDTTVRYDHSKINPSQTTTAEANNWKSQVAGKTMTGNYYGDNNASFDFDNNGNLKITYQQEEYGMTGPRGNKVQKTENVIFWGARNNGTLYGLYYINQYGSYNDISYSFDGSGIQQYYGDTEEVEKLMHPIDTSTHYDNTKLKTPQTTTAEAITWKSQVANNTFTSKSMTTYNYTFELGGNIIEKQGSYNSKTYYFWGALDSSRVVYYTTNYFEDKETWYYCGFSFDITKKEFKKYELSQAYWNSVENWCQNNLDSEGELKPNANLGTYPLPKRSDIDWNTPKTGTLTTK